MSLIQDIEDYKILNSTTFNTSTANSTVRYPSLIIIGSVNGGSSLLNDLFAFHLKSFFNVNKRQDSYYWTKCMPCDFKQYKYNNYKIWNVTESNLCRIERNTKRRIITKPTCNNPRCKKLTNEQLLKQFNEMRFPHSKFICHLMGYTEDVLVHHLDKLSKINSSKTLYFAERCSGYNYSPYVAKILATLFPDTILLYPIREKLSQQYSRYKNFPVPGNVINAEYFDDMFLKLLNIFNNDKVQHGLLNLLNMKQTEHVRNKIVDWYISYPTIAGPSWDPHKREFEDFCPYVNVLMYMEILKFVNGDNKIGFKKLKIVQSEYLFSNVLRAARYVHCITSIHDCNSKEQMKKCMDYYKYNINDIVYESSLGKLKDDNYGKKGEYKILLTDLKTFDKLIGFQKLCDMRLFELIKEYPSLTVGNIWNQSLWIEKRNGMRQIISSNKADNL